MPINERPSNARRAARLPIGIATVTTILAVVTIALAVVNPTQEGSVLEVAMGFVFLLTFAGGGYLLASRRPSNPIGWLFSAMGLALALAISTGEYALYGLAGGAGSLPGVEVAAWVGNWIWLSVFGLIGFVLVLFPDGRTPSPRWRIVLWMLGSGLVTWTVSQALAPGPLTNAGHPDVANPFGVPALSEAAAPLGAVAGIVGLVGLVLSAASVVVRFRRSTGDERRQMKWLVLASLTVMVIICVELPLEARLGADHPLIAVLQPVLFSSLTLIPISVGIAILRYRLYDIDVLINRTLVYGTLSLLLGLTYLGGAVVVGTALRTLTARKDELAVAGSTLLVAALFGPARRLVQSFIDRRFYRSRYDAARTLETFTGRLRDEVDLEALRTDLLSVVGETLSPSHASVWLRR